MIDRGVLDSVEDALANRPRGRGEPALTERLLIADNVNRRMEELNLTNPGLGRLSGLNTALISNLRNGRNNATLDTLAKVAHALGITVADLFLRRTD